MGWQQVLNYAIVIRGLWIVSFVLNANLECLESSNDKSLIAFVFSFLFFFFIREIKVWEINDEEVITRMCNWVGNCFGEDRRWITREFRFWKSLRNFLRYISLLVKHTIVLCIHHNNTECSKQNTRYRLYIKISIFVLFNYYLLL